MGGAVNSIPVACPSTGITGRGGRGGLLVELMYLVSHFGGLQQKNVCVCVCVCVFLSPNEAAVARTDPAPGNMFLSFGYQKRNYVEAYGEHDLGTSCAACYHAAQSAFIHIVPYETRIFSASERIPSWMQPVWMLHETC